MVVYELDFKKLGYKDVPQVTSPYSGKGLPFVINEKGEIYVDYRIDLYEALKKNEGQFKEGRYSKYTFERFSVCTYVFFTVYGKEWRINFFKIISHEPFF